MNTTLSERIATLALDTFSRLPPRCKPRTLPDGRREWTPMSAIALSRPEETCNIKIVALATGTKSLPVTALVKCNGLVLHDCHAEILALRGFSHWLLTEIRSLLDSASYVSDWLEFTSPRGQDKSAVRDTSTPPFRLRRGVEISLFSTEAPCGDASMELLMLATEAAGGDITPWLVSSGGQADNVVKMPLGRGCFSDLGALRRKPARADAKISMSKSCTDKLMLKQFTSALAFPTDTLLELGEEAFLKRLIVYRDRWNEEGYNRAFGAHGRLGSVLSAIGPETPSSIRFFAFEVLPNGFRRFDFEKATEKYKDQRSRASNISALWIARSGEEGMEDAADVVEVLLNGVKQGFKQFDDRERKGSVVCRKSMVREVCKLVVRLAREDVCLPSLLDVFDQDCTSYSELKSRSSHLSKSVVKQKVLDGLGGWPKKTHEDDFILQVLSD